MSPPFLTWAVMALAAIPSSSAHICIQKPVPYDYQSLTADRSPLTKSQYPCKFQNWAVDTALLPNGANEMTVGEAQTLEFWPSTSGEVSEAGGFAAVHDGGTCQLSITLDKHPTIRSVFKVIHSIEGGCPGLDQQTTSFNYTLPPSIPNGDVTFAWSWFPVSSGGPEMYMNCAPVSVTGGADDTTEFDKLPEMLVANIDMTFEAAVTASTSAQLLLLQTDELPKCKGVSEKVLQLPAPGDSLQLASSSVLAQHGLAAPEGECGNAVATAATTAASTQASNTGGVFAPSASSASSASAATTLLTTTAVPSASSSNASAYTSAAAESVATASPAATPIAGSSGSSNSSSACSTDGAVICNGESRFAICDHGNAVWRDVSLGMVCRDGKVVGKETKEEPPFGSLWPPVKAAPAPFMTDLRSEGLKAAGQRKLFNFWVLMTSYFLYQ